MNAFEVCCALRFAKGNSMRRQPRAINRGLVKAAVHDGRFTLADLLTAMLVAGLTAGYLGARYFIG
jgi:hypothetical protein